MKIGRDDAARTLRSICRMLFVFGSVATAIELLLVEHFADLWQIAPFVLIVLALTSVGWTLVAAASTPIYVLRATMLLLIGGGVAGIWLHLRGNLEFEREVSPSLAGLELFWKAIRGASPPSLAPAAMIHLGLLGLASTFGHPLVARQSNLDAYHQGDRP